METEGASTNSEVNILYISHKHFSRIPSDELDKLRKILTEHYSGQF